MSSNQSSPIHLCRILRYYNKFSPVTIENKIIFVLVSLNLIDIDVTLLLLQREKDTRARRHGNGFSV